MSQMTNLQTDEGADAHEDGGAGKDADVGGGKDRHAPRSKTVGSNTQAAYLMSSSGHLFPLLNVHCLLQTRVFPSMQLALTFFKANKHIAVGCAEGEAVPEPASSTPGQEPASSKPEQPASEAKKRSVLKRPAAKRAKQASSPNAQPLKKPAASPKCLFPEPKAPFEKEDSPQHGPWPDPEAYVNNSDVEGGETETPGENDPEIDDPEVAHKARKRPAAKATNFSRTRSTLVREVIQKDGWVVQWFQRNQAGKGTYARFRSPEPDAQTFWSKAGAINHGFQEEDAD